jgi:2-dehydropantoate 2-reductase
MRIAVFGTGGVGGYFGGRLAQSGQDVIFIARGAHLDAIKVNGLKITSKKGDFAINPAQATDNPKNVGAVDAVLIAVKAWSVAEVAEAIRPIVGPDTCILPLENGVDAPAQLSAIFGAERVLGGLCRVISYIGEPGRIQHDGGDDFIALGELDNEPSSRIEALRDAFANAGLNVDLPKDIQAAMWEKFLFISAFSGVGAVTRSPAGVTRALPETRSMLESAMTEAFNVAKARGIAIAEDAVAVGMSAMDRQPLVGEASMQRDIMEGKPSELESQTGAVVRLGRESGVPTPTHDFIYSSLLPQENLARRNK